MTSLSYTRGIPFKDNSPSDDQPRMLINNDHNADIWEVDHFGFNVNSNNSGTHKQVTLTNQTPAPVISGGDGVLYSALFDGQSWPVWKNGLGGGGTILASSPTNASTNGYASLPGGLLMQWGFKVWGTTGTNIPVSFNTNFTISGVNTPGYNVVVTASKGSSPGSTDSFIVPGSISASGFTIFNNGNHTIDGWYWIAIGPKT